jgi:hypothetical protein
MAITYHAGRRIQGLSDTTLGDSGWVTSDSTYINVNTTTEKIDWDLKNDNTDDHITYNLGTALSDTLWVFRCTFRFSTASGIAQFFAGMSSTGGGQNTTQDFIGACILTGDNQFRSVDSDGATIPVTGDNLASYSWASNTDYFLEIKRTSATAYSCTVRTVSHAGSTVATASGTCTNTTVGLQYILFANRVDSNGGSPDLTIDDILIDDGTSTYSSADYEFDFGVQANKPTNVQVGSRFEETDTRKMYHYESPSVTFEDVFDGTHTWTHSHANTSISGGVLNWNSKLNGNVNEEAYISLGTTLSDTAFVCDFDVTIDNWTQGSFPNNIAFGVCLSNNTADYGTSQDSIEIRWRGTASIRKIEVYDHIGSAPEPASADQLFTETISEKTFYVRFTRLSDSSYTIALFPNSADRDAGTNADETKTGTTTSSLNALQYAKVFITEDANTNHVLNGTLDNLKIYNGITSPDNAWEELGT